MRSKLKILSFTAAIAIASMLSTAAFAEAPPKGANADRFVWGGAAENSTYTDVYVPRVVTVLDTKARMSGYGWGGPTAGTLENAKIISENPTNLAVGQYDLLRDLVGKPIPNTIGETYDFSFILGADGKPANLGPECLYLVTNRPGYDSTSAWGNVLADAWDMTIATGKEGSGSLGTFQLLQSIYPDLKDVEVVNAGSATDIVNAVVDGKATHGFFVQRPDPSNAVFKAIAEKKLTIVPVIDSELDGKYEFLELKVANGGFFSNAKFIGTACTQVALITGDPAKADPTKVKRVNETIKRLGDAVTSDPNVLRPDLSTWNDMFDNLKVISGEKLQQLLAASSAAINSTLKRSN